MQVCDFSLLEEAQNEHETNSYVNVVVLYVLVTSLHVTRLHVHQI